ncbi:hypothetical protein ABKN59_008038 [Abortiporus biennis]
MTPSILCHHIQDIPHHFTISNRLSQHISMTHPFLPSSQGTPFLNTLNTLLRSPILTHPREQWNVLNSRCAICIPPCVADMRLPRRRSLDTVVYKTNPCHRC